MAGCRASKKSARQSTWSARIERSGREPGLLISRPESYRGEVIPHQRGHRGRESGLLEPTWHGPVLRPPPRLGEPPSQFARPDQKLPQEARRRRSPSPAINHHLFARWCPPLGQSCPWRFGGVWRRRAGRSGGAVPFPGGARRWIHAPPPGESVSSSCRRRSSRSRRPRRSRLPGRPGTRPARLCGAGGTPPSARARGRHSRRSG